ncbi:MAG TPA: hypothetical protein PLX40_05230 [Candidatus Saccharicenans sp.]|nr:hypothetical protein [Candidatus Saccharicenans sp.]
MKRKNYLSLIALGFFFFSLYLPAKAQDSYSPYSFARISYLQGEARIERGSDLGVEAAEINFVLSNGDKILTDNGLVEISFGRNNFLRLDRYSTLELARLPEGQGGDFSLYLHEGRAYLRISYLEQEKWFSVHTGDASFYVLENGLYRFEADGEDGTLALTLEGSLEAAGQDRSLVFQTGESLQAYEGELEAGASYLAYQQDAFSSWNQERDRVLEMASAPDSGYLPSEIREYETELSSYGRWVYERPYGYVWVPSVTVTDWRPYLVGHWTWYPRIGWTWISAEPWGWAVYHYGRWHWRLGLGWYWIPTVHWGPAWVHWYYDANYVAWCPLSYYNRPLVVINNHVYERYNDAYYPVNSRALVIVKRNQLQSPHSVRAAVRPAELGAVARIKLQQKQPNWRPVTGSRLQPSSLSSPAKLSGNTVRERGAVSKTGLKAPVQQPSSLKTRPVQGKTVVSSRQNSSLPSRTKVEQRISRGQASQSYYPSSDQVGRKSAPAGLPGKKAEVRSTNQVRIPSSSLNRPISTSSGQFQVRPKNNNSQRISSTARPVSSDRLKNAGPTSTSSSTRVNSNSFKVNSVNRQPARPENKRG